MSDGAVVLVISWIFFSIVMALMIHRDDRVAKKNGKKVAAVRLAEIMMVVFAMPIVYGLIAYLVFYRIPKDRAEWDRAADARQS